MGLRHRHLEVRRRALLEAPFLPASRLSLRANALVPVSPSAKHGLSLLGLLLGARTRHAACLQSSESSWCIVWTHQLMHAYMQAQWVSSQGFMGSQGWQNLPRQLVDWYHRPSPAQKKQN